MFKNYVLLQVGWELLLLSSQLLEQWHPEIEELMSTSHNREETEKFLSIWLTCSTRPLSPAAPA